MNSIMKTLTLALTCLTISGFAADPGKAVLGDIPNNNQVVTQEVDSVFQTWTNSPSVNFKAEPSNFWIGDRTLLDLLQPKIEDEIDPEFDKVKHATVSIALGGDTTSEGRGIAIGVPADTRYADNDLILSIDGRLNFYYWRSDYMANV